VANAYIDQDYTATLIEADGTVVKGVDVDCLFKDETNDDEVIQPEPEQYGFCFLPGRGSVGKHTEHMSNIHLTLTPLSFTSRPRHPGKDAVHHKSMVSIVNSLDSSLCTDNLQNMSETMHSFAR
jgi:hypothetical protein